MFKSHIHKIEYVIQTASSLHNELSKEVEKLTDAGVLYGNVSWSGQADGPKDYMRVYRGNIDGKRKFDYIRNKPQNIQEARMKIERGTQCKSLKVKIRELESFITHISNVIEDVTPPFLFSNISAQLDA